MIVKEKTSKKAKDTKEEAVKTKETKENVQADEVEVDWICPECRLDYVEDDIELLWSDLWELEDEVYDLSDTVDELDEVNTDILDLIAETALILEKTTEVLRRAKMYQCMLYIISIIALILGAVSLYPVLAQWL